MNSVETMVAQKPTGIPNTKKEIVVISGSSGLIGSALIRKLAGKYQLIGLDREGYPYPPPEAEWHYRIYNTQRNKKGTIWIVG
jgi:nucleoside-diphosphate-sugar epimerase